MSGVPFTCCRCGATGTGGHACPTLEPDPRDARIAELEAALARASRTELFLRSERPIARRVTELEAALRDAVCHCPCGDCSWCERRKALLAKPGAG